MKLRYLLFILILGSIYLPMTTSAGPIYEDPPTEEQPLLQIQKWASDTEFLLGKSVTVYVNISNWSSKTAYNLTITEPFFNPWAIEEKNGYENGYEPYIYVAVDPGASIYYEYTIILLEEGKYTIGATEIEYYNEESFLFRARTYKIELDIYVIIPPPDLSELWNTLRNISLAIIAFPIVIFIINWLIWRKK